MSIRPPERLNTRRLILRRPTLPDAEPIFEEYAQDPEVTRYLAWQPHRSLSDTRAFLEGVSARWDSGERYAWALTFQESDRPIGMLGCTIREHEAGLGYPLARKYWGQGLMAEAVSAAVQWLLEQPSIFRCWAVCDTTHTASARVLEKVGMQREGILRRLVVHPNLSPEPRDVE